MFASDTGGEFQECLQIIRLAGRKEGRLPAIVNMEIFSFWFRFLLVGIDVETSSWH